MDKRKRITGGILAVLAATVVACGSLQGAAGKADPERGGGSNYLTSDRSYGVGLMSSDDADLAGVPSDASGPALQP